MDGRSTLESVQQLDTAYFPPIISVPASLTLKNPDWGGRRRRGAALPPTSGSWDKAIQV